MNVNELNKYIKNQKLIKSMHHNYQKGNIVRFDGQEMKIKDVKAKQLSLGTLAMQVSCKQSIEKSQKKEFHNSI